MPKVIFSPLAPAIKLINSFEIHLVCIDISSRSGRKFAGIRYWSECQDCEERKEIRNRNVDVLECCTDSAGRCLWGVGWKTAYVVWHSVHSFIVNAVVKGMSLKITAKPQLRWRVFFMAKFEVTLRWHFGLAVGLFIKCEPMLGFIARIVQETRCRWLKIANRWYRLRHHVPISAVRRAAPCEITKTELQKCVRKFKSLVHVKPWSSSKPDEKILAQPSLIIRDENILSYFCKNLHVLSHLKDNRECKTEKKRRRRRRFVCFRLFISR